MESADAIFGPQSDHEPTPNPSWEGNSQSADERLLSSREGSGLDRFMESPLSFFPHALGP